MSEGGKEDIRWIGRERQAQDRRGGRRRDKRGIKALGRWMEEGEDENVTNVITVARERMEERKNGRNFEILPRQRRKVQRREGRRNGEERGRMAI